MNRIILGAVGALVLASLGMFWMQGRAELQKAVPPPDQAATNTAPDVLPSVEVADMIGPELPEATEQTREQRRFGRYDRDRDGRITRAEMLSTRTDEFRKLDKDGNNLLTFEEWAHTTVEKFEGADTNGDLWLSSAEFRRTAPPPPKPKPKCSCK